MDLTLSRLRLQMPLCRMTGVEEQGRMKGYWLQVGAEASFALGMSTLMVSTYLHPAEEGSLAGAVLAQTPPRRVEGI